MMSATRAIVFTKLEPASESVPERDVIEGLEVATMARMSSRMRKPCPARRLEFALVDRPARAMSRRAQVDQVASPWSSSSLASARRRSDRDAAGRRSNKAAVDLGRQQLRR